MPVLVILGEAGHPPKAERPANNVMVGHLPVSNFSISLTPRSATYGWLLSHTSCVSSPVAFRPLLHNSRPLATTLQISLMGSATIIISSGVTVMSNTHQCSQAACATACRPGTCVNSSKQLGRRTHITSHSGRARPHNPAHSVHHASTMWNADKP